MHLIAARTVSVELLAEQRATGQTPLIEGTGASEPQPHLYEPALE
jgi:hypothetical protein